MKKHLPFLILLSSFLLRIIYGVIIHPPASFIHSDIAIYESIADAILKNSWSVSHFFQPVGFPLFIAAIKMFSQNWSYWLAILQAISGTLTLFLMGRSVRKLWGENQEIGTLILGALHVPWIIFTGYAMPETIYTLGLALLLWSSVQILHPKGNKFAGSIIWGLTFIVSFYIKGQHAFLLPLFLLGIIVATRKNIKYAVIISSIVIAGMAAHWSLTYSKTGVGKISSDTGGLNFVEGKCPSKKNTDPVTGITWWSPLYHSLHMDKHKVWDQPFSNSSYYMKQGLKCIERNPWVMIQSLESIPYLFFGNSLWPVYWQPIGAKVRLFEVLFVFFSIPGLLIFFLYTGMHQKINDLIIWMLPVLALFLLVYVFKSEIRYRIPFDVFIVPMSLKGWAEALKGLNDQRLTVPPTTSASG